METAVDLYHAILPELPTALRIKPVLLTLPLTAWPILLPSLLAASFPHHASDPLASCVFLKGHGSFPHRGIPPNCSLSTLECPPPHSVRTGSFFRLQLLCHLLREVTRFPSLFFLDSFFVSFCIAWMPS